MDDNAATYQTSSSNPLSPLRQPILQCPFASLTGQVSYPASCPHHNIHPTPPPSSIVGGVPPSKVGGKYTSSVDTARLLEDIGGGDRIRDLSTRFYAHVFQDKDISKFIFKGDGAIEHGVRFGNWLIEKMGGEGTPWSDSGRHGVRSKTHSQAWYSPYREDKHQGKRFKLDDCRIWMRLMFWAGREVGLDQYKAFWNWYITFIQHFIAVYEYSAPPFTGSDEQWSLDSKNISKYIEDRYSMVDVVGIEHAY